MKVSSLFDVEPGSGPRSVAIGTFDGVHLGHREVIKGNDTVLTFEPHPLSVIHPEATPKLLNTFAVKRDLIAALGVAELVVIPFDREFASQAADEFAADVLARRLGAERVSVGENFRFGRGAQGDPAFLRGRPEFSTNVAPLVEVAGETVSSSHIRGLVAAGDVSAASDFLGGPFVFEGEVVAGDRRGRELNMPTANLVPDDALVAPGHGVYAALANGPPGRRQRGRSAHLRDGAGAAGGGPSDRLRGRPVRADDAAGLPRAHARREAFRLRRCPRAADAPGRGAGGGDLPGGASACPGLVAQDGCYGVPSHDADRRGKTGDRHQVRTR